MIGYGRHRHEALLYLALLSTGMVIACSPVSEAPPTTSARATHDVPGQTERTATVVTLNAVSPINLEHPFFYSGSEIYPNGSPRSVTLATLDQFGVQPENVITFDRRSPLAPRSTAEAQALLDDMVPGQVYWVRDTNILLVRDPNTEQEGTPSSAPPTSEAEVTALQIASILRAAPKTVVLVVIGGPGVGAYSSQHPLTDIYLSFPAASGLGSVLPLYQTGYYQAAVEHGKLMVGISGEDPQTPSNATDAEVGPWFFMTIGAWEEGEREGSDSDQAFPVDFVADGRFPVPGCTDCADRQHIEMATNAFQAGAYAAGVIADVLRQLRETYSHRGGIVEGPDGAYLFRIDDRPITGWDLRRALEEAAALPDLGDFMPTISSEPADVSPVTPIVPNAEWVTTGWGLLSADDDLELLNRVATVLQNPTLRYKPDLHCQYMATWMRLREAYWGRVAPQASVNGDRAVGNYIYCDGVIDSGWSVPPPLGAYGYPL